MVNGKKIAFGVDSFEDYKMWFEEDFVELADLLYEKKIFDFIYLICGPNKSHIAKKIISLSKKNYFIDCSSKDLQGVILALKNSQFFVGNNSGPLNLSAALGLKTFGLIANDPISELKYSKIEIIKPDNYDDESRCRDRIGMKKLKLQKVYQEIIKKI
jgi:ADP-heptose:LPS heptosyltransferase